MYLLKFEVIDEYIILGGFFRDKKISVEELIDIRQVENNLEMVFRDGTIFRLDKNNIDRKDIENLKGLVMNKV